MARPVTRGPLDICQMTCPHMDLSVERQVVYASSEPVLTSHILICSHEAACLMWHKKFEKTVFQKTGGSFCIGGMK